MGRILLRLPWSQSLPSGACRFMKCPFCREGDFGVVDSRNHAGEFPIRRRRSCDRCKRRAWTVEHIEENPLKVVK